MNEKPYILISQCLLGIHCRYDGSGAWCPALEVLMKVCAPIPVCPEQLGGLPTPRPPAECRDGRVILRTGEDVTGAFEKGAEQALRLARLYGVRWAVLKQRSPSCGSCEIYNGRFDGTRIPGRGITAQRLVREGIRVFDENQVHELIEILEDEGR